MRPLKYAFTLFLLFLISSAKASQINITAFSTANLYTCPYTCDIGVVDINSLLVSGYVQGALKFSTESISGSILSAKLLLTPYSGPFSTSTMEIYGYGTSIGKIVSSDADAGNLLGVYSVVVDQSPLMYFDVTSFVANTKSPYLAFNLRTNGGTADFSSLKVNYGLLPMLIVETVPLPSTIWLFSSAFIGLFGATRSRR